MKTNLKSRPSVRTTITRPIMTAFGAMLALGLVPSTVLGQAVDSGSTGADGAFAPAQSVELQLPPDGIFNFTSVDVPAGVTVTFRRNALNTPLTFLASGDVTVAGTIDVGGQNGGSVDEGPVSGFAGIVPGGSGGFGGGRGGRLDEPRGGNGLGPGAATGVAGCGGSGGGFGTQGLRASNACGANTAGTAYGTRNLLPLIGGSGGAGGSARNADPGAGGGGGGGAILIASSGSVTISGSIQARGGRGGNLTTAGSFGGGGGSGGAIRIVATNIAGNGTIDASGGAGGASETAASLRGGTGGDGRIRLESNRAITFSGTATPVPDANTVSPIFPDTLPTLRITTVGGVAVPAAPTGNADVVLPADVANPVTIGFTTSGVPVGRTITVTATPDFGASATAVSTPLGGTEPSATASADITLPQGNSVLSATVSFVVVGAAGDAMSRFAQGERVERVELAASPGGASKTTFVTVSGKRHTWPASTVALN